MAYLHEDKHDSLKKQVLQSEAKRRTRRRKQTRRLKKIAARPGLKY
jgi:hypothetical protein